MNCLIQQLDSNRPEDKELLMEREKKDDYATPYKFSRRVNVAI
jgi:hypothetical protein